MALITTMMTASPLGLGHLYLFLFMLFGLFPVVMVARHSDAMRKLLLLMILGGAMFEMNVHYDHFWHYRGDVRGFELGIALWSASALFLTLLFSARGREQLALCVALPLVRLLLLYVAVIGGSLWVALQPVFAWMELFRFCSMLLWAWVLSAMLLHASNRRLLLLGLLVITWLEAVIVSFQVIGLDYARAFGSFAHPNLLAAFANVVGMLMLGQWFYAAQDGRREDGWICALTWLLCFAMMLASASRAGLGAWLLGVLVMIAYAYRYGAWRLAWSVRKLALLMTMIVLLELLANPEVLLRLITAPPETWTTRWDMLMAGWAMLMDYPLGIGANNFAYALNAFPDRYAPSLEIGDRGVLHNIYMLNLVESGWLGLLLFLALLWVTVRVAWNVEDDRFRAWSIGALGAIVTLAAHGMLDWVMRNFIINALWFLLMVLVQLPRLMALRATGLEK